MDHVGGDPGIQAAGRAADFAGRPGTDHQAFGLLSGDIRDACDICDVANV
ncbi:hypothetical protein [Streptomyces lavendulae]